MNKFWQTLPLFFLLLMGWNCKKAPIPNPLGPDLNLTRGVFILNEGGFTFGNASLSHLQLETNELSHELFKNKNGRPLGDVLQHMAIQGDRAYLVLNNSGRIEEVKLQTMEWIRSIEGLTSPRYLVAVNEKKAYVSDLYADAIHIIDLSLGQKSGEVPLLGNAEEMLAHNGSVFITNRDHPYLYVLDVATDQLVDSIAIGANANAITLDKMGMLWVYCSGNPTTNELGGLYRIDPIKRQVQSTLAFADHHTGAWPRLAMNAAKDTLYFLKADVYRLAIEDQTLADEPFIKAAGRTLYALGINPEDGNIFIGDAIDYVQKGLVFQYSTVGEIIQSFKVGVIPGGFVFY